MILITPLLTADILKISFIKLELLGIGVFSTIKLLYSYLILIGNDASFVTNELDT